MSVSRQAKQGPPFHQNEILTLKNKMRHYKAEFTTERAVLKQKIGLLQTQINDLIDREARRRKMYETMLATFKDLNDKPDKARDYFNTQLAKSNQASKESLKMVEQQYLQTQEVLVTQNEQIQLENAELKQKCAQMNKELTSKHKECDLKLQQARLIEKQLALKIQMGEEQNLKLTKQVELLNQKLKDQSQSNASQAAQLVKQFQSRSSSDAQNHSIDMFDSLQLSVQAIDVPTGLGRSRSPAIGKDSSYKIFKRQQSTIIKDLQNQIHQKDNAMSELIEDKHELCIEMEELKKDNKYLHEQLGLIQKEKQAIIELLETQIKRQRHEYMQQVNILGNEKQNAKSELSHLQNIIKCGASPGDTLPRKLNASACLNSNDSSLKTSRFNAVISQNSSKPRAEDSEQPRIVNNTHDLSCSSNNNIVASKCRSRNPSSAGLLLGPNSIPVKGLNISVHKQSHRSGNIQTLKELATARNMATQICHKRQNPTNKLLCIENQKEVSHIKDGITQESSPTNQQDNPYKRSHKSKGGRCNTSDGRNKANIKSDAHPTSKEYSEDINGALMHSVVSLFPNKFMSNKESGVSFNENASIISSFTSSPQESLVKRELENQSEVAHRDRENSKMQKLRDSFDSNEIVSDSPERSAQLPYASGNGVGGLKPTQNEINTNSYEEMLETGEIMKNVHGDLLCKRCNLEFTVQEFLNNETHWKLCLNKASHQLAAREVIQDSDFTLKELESYEQHSESHDQIKHDSNAGSIPELSDNNGSILHHKYSKQDCQDSSDINNSDDEDVESQEHFQQDSLCESGLDNYELYSQQQRYHRYARPQVILETVEQESDECRSSVCESANYISNPSKLFSKEKKAGSKAPSMRYHSNHQDQDNEVGTSQHVKNTELTQSPELFERKKERSDQAVHSSLDSNSSKGSNSIYSKMYKENYNHKHIPKSSVKLSPRHIPNNYSKKTIETTNFKRKASGSPRAFKDITHKVQSENLAFGGRKRSVPPPSCHGIQNFKPFENTKVMKNYLKYDTENTPIGHSHINLLHDHKQESCKDRLYYDKLNSKLSRIENAVKFFYKMNDNYCHWIKEVENIKGFIEKKSERKSKQKINSIYSNRGSAMKTPLTSKKFMGHHMSSRKKNPLDNHLNSDKSQIKKCRRIVNSKDVTPEVVYRNPSSKLEQYISHNEYDVKNLKHHGKQKNPKKSISLNKSDYGPNNLGLTTQNIYGCQSTFDE